MDVPYFVKAILNFDFEEISDDNRDKFQDDFQSLTEADSDSIGHWLKLKRAKGETEDSDEVLLELVIDLHRKINRLEGIIKGEEIKTLELAKKSKIEMIGFHHFKTKDSVFTPNKTYYGRVELKSYPQRNMPIFFSAISENLIEIERIHERDENDWGAYFRAMERVMIREKRRL